MQPTNIGDYSSQLADPELRKVITALEEVRTEPVPEDARRGVTAAVGRGFWRLLGATETETPIKKTARLIKDVVRLEKRSLELGSPVTGLSRERALLRHVEALATAESLIAAKIALMASLKALAAKHKEETQFEALQRNITTLESSYSLTGRNIKERTEEYSASKEVFERIMVEIIKPPRDQVVVKMPHVQRPQLTLAASTALEQASLKVKHQEAVVQVIQQTLETQQHPDTGEALTPAHLIKLQTHLVEAEGRLATAQLEHVKLEMSEMEKALSPLINEKELIEQDLNEVEMGIRQPHEASYRNHAELIAALDRRISDMRAPRAALNIRLATAERLVKTGALRKATAEVDETMAMRSETVTKKRQQINRIDAIQDKDQQGRELTDSQQREIRIVRQTLDLDCLRYDYPHIQAKRREVEGLLEAIEVSIATLKQKADFPGLPTESRAAYLAEIARLQEEGNQVRDTLEPWKTWQHWLEEEIGRVKASLKADKDVAQLMDSTVGVDTTGLMRRIGSYLSIAIDESLAVSVSDGTRVDTYHKWMDSEWGPLLVDFSFQADPIKRKAEEAGSQQEFQEFAKQVGEKRDELNQLKAEISAYQLAYREAEKAQASPDLAKRQTAAKLKEDITGKLETLHAGVQVQEISLRAAYMKRMVNSIGARMVMDKQLAQEILLMEDTMSQQGADISKLTSQREALRQRRNQLKQECTILEAAYQQQMAKYECIQRPQIYVFREIVQADGVAQKVMAVGGAVSKAFFGADYVAPQQFKMQLEAARLGYHWKTGLAQLGTIRSESMAGGIANLATEFLRWADDHPVAAQAMAADIALTISALGRGDLADTLLTTIRARLYTRAALGELGLDVMAEPPLTEKDFLFLAIADIAKHGPLAATVPNAAQAFATSFLSGAGLVGAGTRAAATIAVGYAGNRMIQRFVQETDPAVLQPLNIMLSVARGAPANAVMQEQSALISLRIAGNARRAMKNPKGVWLGVRRAFSDLRKTLRRSKGWEFAARFATNILLPAAGVTVAVGLVASAIVFSGGAVAIVLAIGWGMLVLSGASMAPPLSNLLWNWIWPNTTMDLERDNARELLKADGTDPYTSRIRVDVDNYLGDLRLRSLLPRWSLPRPQIQTLLTTTMVGEPAEPIGSRRKRLQKDFQEALEENMRITLKTHGTTLLRPAEVIQIFQSTLASFRLYEKCRRACEGVSYWSKTELADSMQSMILSDFFTRRGDGRSGWMIAYLDAAFIEDFVTKVAMYKTPEQFQAAEAQARASSTKSGRLLDENVDSDLASRVPLAGPLRRQNSDPVLPIAAAVS